MILFYIYGTFSIGYNIELDSRVIVQSRNSNAVPSKRLAKQFPPRLLSDLRLQRLDSGHQRLVLDMLLPPLPLN
jgi:hypothetical protein